MHHEISRRQIRKKCNPAVARIDPGAVADAAGPTLRALCTHVTYSNIASHWYRGDTFALDDTIDWTTMVSEQEIGRFHGLKTLLESRESDGSTPLHCAAWKGHAHMVRLLLSLGADVNAKQQDEFTPLQAADQSSDTRLRDLLTQHGATD